MPDILQRGKVLFFLSDVYRAHVRRCYTFASQRSSLAPYMGKITERAIKSRLSRDRIWSRLLKCRRRLFKVLFRLFIYPDRGPNVGAIERFYRLHK